MEEQQQQPLVLRLSAVPIESLFDRAFQAPHTLGSLIRKWILWLKGIAHYDDYQLPEMFDDVERQLAWAESRHDWILVRFLYFSLYAHYPEVRRFVNEVEKRARPGTSDVSLFRLGEYVRAVLCDAQTHDFRADNAARIMAHVEQALVLGVVCRWPCILAHTGFDDKAMIDTGERRASCPRRLVDAYDAHATHVRQLNQALQRSAQLDPQASRRLLSELPKRFSWLSAACYHPYGRQLRQRDAEEEDRTRTRQQHPPAYLHDFSSKYCS